MIKIIKDFYKFVKYATYSPFVFFIAIIPAIAVFPLCISLFHIVHLLIGYCAFFGIYFLAQIFVGYATFRHMRNIGYFEAISTYSDRPLIWFDISFKNWMEILGIILRKIKNRKTIKSPTQVPVSEFFNTEGLSVGERSSKISKYRRFVHDHKFLYPAIQWRLFQIHEFIARYQIDQEMESMYRKKEKAYTEVKSKLSWQVILGVSTDAAFGEVKKAYQKLAMKHHPDKGGDTGKFQELQGAWQLAKKHFGHGI